MIPITDMWEINLWWHVYDREQWRGHEAAANLADDAIVWIFRRD